MENITETLHQMDAVNETAVSELSLEEQVGYWHNLAVTNDKIILALESNKSDENETSRTSLLDLLNLSSAQTQALADKYNKLSKLQIREIADEVPRANFDSVVEMYVTYIIQKTANDFIFAKMRDRWVADLGLLVPRLMTKDQKLSESTDKAVAKIALEITDEFARKTVLEQCAKTISKSTDRLNAVQCQERLEELFASAWKN